MKISQDEIKTAGENTFNKLKEAAQKKHQKKKGSFRSMKDWPIYDPRDGKK